MRIIGYLLYAIGVFITVGWMFGIRTNSRTGEGVNKGIVISTTLFVLCLVLIPTIHLSPFHLLWMFPLSLAIGSVTVIASASGNPLASALLSLLWIPSGMLWRLVCVGVDLEEGHRRFKIVSRAKELVIREGLSNQEAIRRAEEEIG